VAVAAPAAAALPANATYGEAAISTSVVTVPMTFPVLGATSYTDTFLACRSGCARKHFGQDLMGPKMRPLVAAFNGVVSSVKRESTVGEGNYVTVRGDNGWSANYIHVNNDTPGTDDGKGTARYAFAEGIRVGKRVFAGQLLGWSGDSGNAESTGAHLHFELRRGDAWGGTVYNAFSSLKHAGHVSAPIIAGPHNEGTYIHACAACAPYLIEKGKKHYLNAEVARQMGFNAKTTVMASTAEFNWYNRGADVELPTGRAYRGPDGVIWFVDKHVRNVVPTPEALALLGIPASRVRTTTAAGLATVPKAPAGTPLPVGPTPTYDNALLRSADGDSLWVIRAGQRHLVSDTLTLSSWGLQTADAVTVTDEQAAAPGFPTVGKPLLVRDGLVLKDSAWRVFLVTSGTRRPFPTWSIYHAYGFTAVPQTPGGAAILRIPVGAAMPS
jgi:hypothetical protein